MVQYNHLNYGRSLVNSMKLFASHHHESFFQSPNSDTLQAISNRLSQIDYPVLVAIDGKDADFTDNGAEVLLKKPQYFFMFLKPVADSENPEEIMAAQEECETYAGQAIARMMEDCRNYTNGLTELDTNSFMVRSIGPLGDKLYGVILGFNTEAGAEYKINNAFWV